LRRVNFPLFISSMASSSFWRLAFVLVR
jgi:hypothetical protein